MKQVCLACNRFAQDRNLFCQEIYCPAEMSPTVLGYGEWLGDIEIAEAIKVTRSAVLYEATHNQEKVLLKVAHPGEEHKERLKREAEFLRDCQFEGEVLEGLPVLLPPYTGTDLAADAVGKTMLGGHLLYFCLFEFFEGETLGSVLLEKPLLWLNHVGWITISLATLVNYLHLKGYYHLGVNPDSLLVRFDDKPWVPRILLYDLGIASPKVDIDTHWYTEFVNPAYLAPELIASNGHAAPTYRSDVYGLGLVLYEMLIGEPAFTYSLRSDQEIRTAVLNYPRVRMYRKEESEEVARISRIATDRDPFRRQENAAELGEALIQHFGHVPDPEPSRWPSKNTILVFVFALLAIALIIVVAITS